MRIPFKSLLLVVCLLPVSAISHDDLDEYYWMKSHDIISAFAGYTLFSTNKRTQDKIQTFLDPDGTVKQSIAAAKITRKGKWHAAGNQLCLHWDESPSEFCFDKVLFHDNVFLLVKNDRVESEIGKIQMGNRTGF